MWVRIERIDSGLGAKRTERNRATELQNGSRPGHWQRRKFGNSRPIKRKKPEQKRKAWKTKMATVSKVEECFVSGLVKRGGTSLLKKRWWDLQIRDHRRRRVIT